MSRNRTLPRKVILAKPRGFCAGVGRAIDVVSLALELYQPPVYVRKQIVHNRYVIEGLSRKGAIFVDEIDDVPEGALVIISAHGASPDVFLAARQKHLNVIDATCPLVTKVHAEVRRFAGEGQSIILIGHEGHDEVIGTMGELPGRIQLVSTVEQAEQVQVPDCVKVAVTTQTTLSVDDARAILDVLRRRFPRLVTPASDDICYATQNRQAAVKQIAQQADLVLVVGSDNSSNSERLREVAEASGARAYLIDNASEIQTEWLVGVDVVGITAGASAPEKLVQDVVDCFREMGVETIEEFEATRENVAFALPTIRFQEFERNVGGPTSHP
ncbi:MAG: 4-hydroxy-3-methylbut-2-enyl diphosphate reductase [Acidobacteria bacterium]|nr:MAG: 4-hydroxy-3-methylbut-2-enyl diphosphate reductase [Acidobacteriota bacterium]